SEQRMLLIRDTARIGTLLAAMISSALQRDEIDPDVATRCATLANARRSNLVALGLDRVAKDVPDLRAYLASRAPTNSPEPARAAIDPRARYRGGDSARRRLRAGRCDHRLRRGGPGKCLALPPLPPPRRILPGTTPRRSRFGVGRGAVAGRGSAR